MEKKKKIGIVLIIFIVAVMISSIILKQNSPLYEFDNEYNYKYTIEITQPDYNISVVMIPAPLNWSNLLESYTVEEGALRNISLSATNGAPWLSIECEGPCTINFSYISREADIHIWELENINGTTSTKIYSELINGEHVNLAVSFTDGVTYKTTRFGSTLFGGWEWAEISEEIS